MFELIRKFLLKRQEEKKKILVSELKDTEMQINILRSENQISYLQLKLFKRGTEQGEILWHKIDRNNVLIESLKCEKKNIEKRLKKT